MTSERSERIEFEQWKRACAERQQSLYVRFGDREWDQIPRTERSTIQQKVSWYVFNKDYKDLSETEELSERPAVDNATNKLLELSGGDEHILLGCVYVEILLENETPSIIPVLRTKKRTDERLFFYEVYSNRVYRSWEDFEENNKLPKCWMCYPKEGFYRFAREESSEGRVLLKFRESPACGTILPITDIISLVGGGVCTGILAVSIFFPPLLAVEVTALVAGGGIIGSSVYGITRGICNLVDRDKHDQSVSVTDPDALRDWLNIFLSAGSAVTAGGAVVIRGAALSGMSAVVNSNSLRLAATILRYVSISVNSAGILAIIVDLVINFMKNGPRLSDMNKLVSLCLFIGNIVISTTQAEYIIRVMADQPQRIRNAFNMVRNTATIGIKCIVTRLSISQIIEYVTGDVSMNILRNIGLRRTANIIASIRHHLRRCQIENNNIAVTLIEIFRECFPFISELILEIKQAYQKMEKWCRGTLLNIKLRNHRLTPNLFISSPLEISDEVERVLDVAELREPDVRAEVAKGIIRLIDDVANETDNFNSIADYVEMCEFICDKVHNRYDVEHIIQECEAANYMTDERKGKIFCEIFSSLRQSIEKKNMVESFQKNRRGLSTFGGNLIFKKPVYQNEETSVYYFETSSKFSVFNQFVYDAACELLMTNELFTTSCEFYLHPRETILLISDSDKRLVFNYEIERNKTVGIVILDEKKMN